MFNSIVLAAVNSFTGTKEKPAGPDKRGKMPVILSIIGGKCPNKALVLAGTVAENLEIEVGNTYLLQCRETAPSEEYGRSFNWTKLDHVKGLDIIKATNEMGDAEVFNITNVEATTRASLEIADAQ